MALGILTIVQDLPLARYSPQGNVNFLLTENAESLQENIRGFDSIEVWYFPVMSKRMRLRGLLYGVYGEHTNTTKGERHMLLNKTHRGGG